LIPYTKHHLEAGDIVEVLRVLQGGANITQGTMIDWFEDEFKAATGSRYAVAVSSGTAALHASLVGAGINPGDEVIVPSMTFVATANAIKYINAIPVFADIDPETLLIDPKDIENKITKKTKAIITVDFAGQPVDYTEIKAICKKYNLILIADACHSLGATYKSKKVGILADFNCFSLHATKLITSAEGGVITTNDKDAYLKMKAFRDHGRVNGDMVFLGYNYRMTHLQAGLCIHQIIRISD
jgi:dTDP-4-amino-4,6-dideoxygalactose transaminase